MTPEVHCPKCSSGNVVFSKKRGAYICEDCGHVLPEAPIAPLRIFLSYGHDANEELVRRIKTDLEKRGHDVWFDKNEIKFGDEWRRSITDGILQSNRVLSFLSKHSTRDPGVCLDEIAIAIGAKGGNIQTILVESEREVKLPPSIAVSTNRASGNQRHSWSTIRHRHALSYLIRFPRIAIVGTRVLPRLLIALGIGPNARWNDNPTSKQTCPIKPPHPVSGPSFASSSVRRSAT